MDKLYRVATIKKILEESGFFFKKSLGQNFLINPTVCPKMAESACLDGVEGVLEIGPGIGVLTNELAKRAKKVVAIELDSRLRPVLEKTLGEHKNVKIIFGDALKLDLAKIIADEFSGMRVSVCANLPYYVTSPILMRLLESRLNIESITVMVQYEAARRICAEVGSREAGAVTVAVNYYSSTKILFDVSRGSFMPQPNVDSTVIKLDILPKPAITPNDEKGFFKFVHAAFSQRRKTLVNSVFSVLGIEKSKICGSLEAAGISPTIRAEKLTLQQLCEVYNTLESKPFINKDMPSAT